MTDIDIETVLAESDEDRAALDALDTAAEFSREVAIEAYRLRVRDAARDKVAAERAAATEMPPFDAGLLGDILRRPAEPPHRVDGLIPSDGGTLVVAQRKTGKTTLLLNLTRSLILGGEFLGRFPVRPVNGRVGFLNFEVSGHQIARWADEHDIPPDRLFLVNLRGRRNPLAIDTDRAELAARLREQEIEALIVDPFGRAFTGKSQNDPGDVGAWLADLDRFARGEAGVADLLLTAHAGWDGERTRGSSALEDWADVIITLTRDKDDDQERFLRAEGRDVHVEEDNLRFDATTRTLTLTGTGSRKNAAKARNLDKLVPAVVEIVTSTPGLTGYKIGQILREGGHGFQKGDESKAAQLAVDRGLLDCEHGGRNSIRYFPNTSPPPPPHTSPMGNSDDLPDLPYKGEVVHGEVTPEDRPEVLAPFANLPGRCPECGFDHNHQGPLAEQWHEQRAAG